METRARRTKEEMIADIDKKIAFHKAHIEQLEAKKSSILNPKPRKNAVIKTIISKATESGMSEQEIAEKLGIEL